ncbi:protein-tyrosine phosphatase family protein [Acidianus manzaensis]|uniref:Protein phosphatase n=1 Tax=Acidianus manzaensis TaxID=282676 RepID=A0A1W6JX69_9CREN|nr:dual specificity protein phosphatase family protein [Acidianus manzaensis]ARM74876.1 protein phosphatase [Acidianus manzaensis]
MYWVRKNIIGGSELPYTIDEIKTWKNKGVKKVLVLPEDWEIEEAWGDTKYYFSLLEENNLKYLHIPIPDGYPPTESQFEEIMQWLDGKGNLVHCVGGIGRTGTVIAAYLIIKEGFNPIDAVDEVRNYRPGAVQTLQQHEFLFKIGNKYGRLST